MVAPENPPSSYGYGQDLPALVLLAGDERLTGLRAAASSELKFCSSPSSLLLRV